MELADAKRLKALEKENAELKKMLAESMLENRVLKEVNAKNGRPFAQKNSRIAYRCKAHMFGAKGLLLGGDARLKL